MIENMMRFIFTTFCLMILINGSNFIDGLNGLLLGYSLLIILLPIKSWFNLLLIFQKLFYFILVVFFYLY